MSPLDLVRGRDGKMVLTKLQAATFHLLLALTVAAVSYLEKRFIPEMWTFYGMCAIGHAIYDKTAAQVKDFKDKKLQQEVNVPPTS